MNDWLYMLEPETLKVTWKDLNRNTQDDYEDIVYAREQVENEYWCKTGRELRRDLY